ncbi:hypothetical protein V5O48_016792 [Marasmius crinis-equi]|uniref:Uncharacterized protein n=1 Tax=Marasmius crinis-equi TaxID=585013 RepID=A0ABR3EQT5_9AGAR
MFISKRQQQYKEQREREQKERDRKSKISRRNRRYRRRHKDEVNTKARERMARKRAAMSAEEKEIAKAKQKSYSRTSYQSRRNDILQKEEKKRHGTFIEQHGQKEFDQAYPSRHVWPRYILGLKDDPTNAVEYKKELKRWKKKVAAEKYHEDYMRSDMSAIATFETLEPEYRRLELKGVIERDWLKAELNLSGENLKLAIHRRSIFREETLERLHGEQQELFFCSNIAANRLYRTRVRQLKREITAREQRARWIPSASERVPMLKLLHQKAQDDLDYTSLQMTMLSDRILRLSKPSPPNNITRPRRKPKLTTPL